jgi:type IV secretory pathway VirB3-like protein
MKTLAIPNLAKKLTRPSFGVSAAICVVMSSTTGLVLQMSNNYILSLVQQQLLENTILPDLHLSR